MTPRSESPTLPKDRVGKRPRHISALSALPTELLHMILRHAAVDLHESITLSSVCKQWRTITVGAPEFWRDTRYLASVSKVDSHAAQCLLEICAERSADTLSHVALSALQEGKGAKSWLSSCARSVDSWKHATLTDESFCSCGYCQVSIDAMGASPEGSKFGCPRLAISTLLTILNSASNLESISISLKRDGDDFCCVASTLLHCTIQPRKATIKAWSLDDLEGEVHLQDCPHDGECPTTYFDELTAEIEDLSVYAFQNSKSDHVPHWISWSWKRLCERAQHIKYFKSCDALAHWSTQASLTFPNLREMVLFPLQDSERVQERAFGWNLSVLQVFYGTPSAALRLLAPNVTCACLALNDQREVPKYESAVAQWADLQNLTLLVKSRNPLVFTDRLQGSEARAATLSEGLATLLTPIQGHPVKAPQLRHLGVYCAVGISSRKVELRLDLDPDWAALPWTLRTKIAWSWYSRPALRDDRPTLSAQQLLKIVQERRRLSLGLDLMTAAADSASQVPDNSASSFKAFKAPSANGARCCLALQSIKLAGVRFQEANWREILRDCPAEVSCFPDPDLDLSQIPRNREVPLVGDGVVVTVGGASQHT